jgi:hypothetical protein
MVIQCQRIAVVDVAIFEAIPLKIQMPVHIETRQAMG